MYVILCVLCVLCVLSVLSLVSVARTVWDPWLCGERILSGAHARRDATAITCRWSRRCGGYAAGVVIGAVSPGCGGVCEWAARCVRAYGVGTCARVVRMRVSVWSPSLVSEVGRSQDSRRRSGRSQVWLVL